MDMERGPLFLSLFLSECGLSQLDMCWVFGIRRDGWNLYTGAASSAGPLASPILLPTPLGLLASAFNPAVQAGPDHLLSLGGAAQC